MSGFTPKVPIPLQIRRIIFEDYNDEDGKFNNDEIFESIRRGGDVDPDWIIDDLEPAINGLCDSGAARNIAQNFTTIWLKLSERLERAHCGSCGNDVFMGASEERICPGCKSTL